MALRRRLLLRSYGALAGPSAAMLAEGGSVRSTRCIEGEFSDDRTVINNRSTSLAGRHEREGDQSLRWNHHTRRQGPSAGRSGQHDPALPNGPISKADQFFIR
jgi:hypothetical protein